jgi:hypothetical protein
MKKFGSDKHSSLFRFVIMAVNSFMHMHKDEKAWQWQTLRFMCPERQ